MADEPITLQAHMERISKIRSEKRSKAARENGKLGGSKTAKIERGGVLVHSGATLVGATPDGRPAFRSSSSRCSHWLTRHGYTYAVHELTEQIASNGGRSWVKTA